jgi:hypothetical protein
MSRRSLLFILLLAALLFGVAFYFYGEAQKQQREVDTLRELQLSMIDSIPEYEPIELEPEPVYDPTDLDQTPPGIMPFTPSSLCYTHWGLQVQQYCEAGNSAVLDIVEGDTQDSAMADLKMCLNDMIQRIDAYDKPDMRPMDSEIPLNEASRRSLACDLTGRYGERPIFETSSVAYMIKEDVESGSLSRLENR